MKGATWSFPTELELYAVAAICPPLPSSWPRSSWRYVCKHTCRWKSALLQGGTGGRQGSSERRWRHNFYIFIYLFNELTSFLPTLFFLFWLCHVTCGNLRSLVPGPWQWKLGVLTTESPGNFQDVCVCVCVYVCVCLKRECLLLKCFYLTRIKDAMTHRMGEKNWYF